MYSIYMYSISHLFKTPGILVNTCCWTNLYFIEICLLGFIELATNWSSLRAQSHDIWWKAFQRTCFDLHFWLKNVEFDIELSANPLIYRQSSLDLAKGSEIIIQNRILKKSANSDIRLDLWFNVTAKLLPKNTLCISQTVA